MIGRMSLCVLNGSYPNDCPAEFTYWSVERISELDYIIISENVVRFIESFEVRNYYHSDYLPLIMLFKIPLFKPYIEEWSNKLLARDKEMGYVEWKFRYDDWHIGFRWIKWDLTESWNCITVTENLSSIWNRSFHVNFELGNFIKHAVLSI